MEFQPQIIREVGETFMNRIRQEIDRDFKIRWGLISSMQGHWSKSLKLMPIENFHFYGIYKV